ncbi:MAG: GntR family transcriptional regulator [Actinomycetota bacterium]|nr:GntR family transcriptional regulator [Actinomycetota bacterium]
MSEETAVVAGLTGPNGKGAIDREAPLPLYYQLKLALLEQFQQNRMQPGDKLPTESAIEQHYGLSRTTIRQALGDLEVEGVIERVQGKGSFLKARPVQHVARLTSFAEDMMAHGRVPSRRMLKSSVVRASPDAAARLRCDVDDKCYYLERLLLADGEKIGFAQTWILIKALGGHEERLQQLQGRSLYRLLREPPIGVELTSGSEVLSARPASADTAGLLECGEGQPLLCVERVARTAEGIAVEWTTTVFPWDRYQYSVEITAP